MMKDSAPAVDQQDPGEASRRLSVGAAVREQQQLLMKRPPDQLFIEYDFDQNGALDEDEFCKLMTAMGMRSQCENLFVTADIDKSGTLELNEFVQMHKQRLALTTEPTPPKEPLKEPDGPAGDPVVLKVPTAPDTASSPAPVETGAVTESKPKSPVPRPVKPDPDEGRDIGIARKLLYRCFSQHMGNPRVRIAASGSLPQHKCTT